MTHSPSKFRVKKVCTKYEIQSSYKGEKAPQHKCTQTGMTRKQKPKAFFSPMVNHYFAMLTQFYLEFCDA